MSETTPPAKLKHLSDDLHSKSKSLSDVPHFFCFRDPGTGKFAHFGNLGDAEACEIIELLAKVHGGEVIDRVVDKIIREGNRDEFPEYLSVGRR